MGRPAVEVVRDELVKVYVAPAELEKINTAASRAGDSCSTWARRLLLAAARRIERRGDG